MGLEEALAKLGRWGRWQLLHYAILCIVFTFPSSWQLFAIVFIAAVTDHHCTPPVNVSLSQSSPREIGLDGLESWANCDMYHNTTSNVTVPCMYGWDFEPTDFTSGKGTIVMEWDLVCADTVLVETSQTVFGAGNFVGTIVFTPLADKFGRKKIVFICLLMMVIFGLAMSFSPNYIAFCIFQFLTGAFSQGLIWAGFIIACELFSTHLRSVMAPMGYVVWSAGMMLMTLWAYLIRDWRNLQMSISIAGFAGLIYFWWAPESLRWLISRGRVEEADKILRTAAKFNKVDLPEKILDDDPALSDMKHQATLLDMMRSHKARRYVFLMMYIVFSNGIMYFGLSLLTSVLPGDRYVNFFVVAFLETPAALLAIFLLKNYGRRMPVCIFHTISAIFLALSSIFAAVTIPGISIVDSGFIVTGLALAGKFGVAGAYVVELIYQQEIYPTPIRATGVGITQGMNVLGSVIAPYFVLVFRLETWIPGTVFAILSIIAAILALWLPETLGRPLPDTVEDIEGWSLTLSAQEKAALKEQRNAKQTENQVCPENGINDKNHADRKAYENQSYTNDNGIIENSMIPPSYSEATNTEQSKTQNGKVPVEQNMPHGTLNSTDL